MLIAFKSQASNDVIYVELARSVSVETIKKIENRLDKIINRYEEANNGDYYNFNIYEAIEKVMNASKLKWYFPRPDVTIYF